MRALHPLTDQKGTSLVEFALILPVLALLLFGLLDFAKAFNYWNDETHLAAEGARWAVVNSNPGGSQSLQQYLQQQADTSELRGLATVCVSFPSNPDTGTSGQVGDPVTVTVKSRYSWLSLVSSRARLSPTATITGSATMRLEAPPTAYAAGSGGTGSCT
ncbi:MAG TPA: TadE/TadG family type IV pilus assembly protein [Gaiellaceae bacterium]|jgi:Flp pilus assembly protein TadG|nr:TadE/TadG family type IV pilus assembly protein [Gaiellaceae bacterium]